MPEYVALPGARSIKERKATFAGW